MILLDIFENKAKHFVDTKKTLNPIIVEKFLKYCILFSKYELDFKNKFENYLFLAPTAKQLN